MTKNEKQAYINAPYQAYYSGFGGIEIKEIEYGIEDYVIYVAGAWCSKKSVHRAKVYYNGDNSYFEYKGVKIPLNECIRRGF